MSNFQALEGVGRGSETQFQVAENLNKLTQQDKGYYWSYLDIPSFMLQNLTSEYEKMFFY